MLLLTEVAGQGVGLYLRYATGLVAEERGPVLRGGHGGGSLGQDDERVSFGVKVEDHDVGGKGLGDGEKTGLIDQGSYLLFACFCATAL
jgi:hypothetical protein